MRPPMSQGIQQQVLRSVYELERDGAVSVDSWGPMLGGPTSDLARAA